MASSSVWTTALDRVAHEHGRVVDDAVVDALAGNSSSAPPSSRGPGRRSAIALEPGDWKIGMATAGLLSSSERSPYCEASISTRATSLRRVMTPFVALDDDVARIARARCRRPSTLIGSLQLAGLAVGRAADDAGGHLHVLLADRRRPRRRPSCRARRSSPDRARCAWRSRRSRTAARRRRPASFARRSLTFSTA